MIETNDKRMKGLWSWRAFNCDEERRGDESGKDG